MEDRQMGSLPRLQFPPGILATGAPPGFSTRNPNLPAYGKLGESTSDGNSSSVMSCEDLENVLLSKSKKEIKKIMEYRICVQQQSHLDHQEEMNLTAGNFSSLGSPSKLPPPSHGLPPPGFPVQQRRGLTYMGPRHTLATAPFGIPNLPPVPQQPHPQPQPWSPARQAARQKNKVEIQQKPLPSQQTKPPTRGYLSNEDVVKKLQELALKVQNLKSTEISPTLNLQDIEQEVLRKCGSTDKNVGASSSVDKKLKKVKEKKKKTKDKKSHSSAAKEPVSNETPGPSGENLKQQCVILPGKPANGAESKQEIKKKKKKKNKEKIEEGSKNALKKSSEKENVLKSGVFSHVELNEDGEFLKPEKTESENTEKKRIKKKKTDENFEPYLPKNEVEKGLIENKLIEAEVRINCKNYVESFVTDPNTGQEILILGLLDRNRALDGDLVAVQIKDEEHWQKQKNGSPLKTGKVVYILERTHHGHTVGSLQYKRGGFMIIPRDPRFPILHIPTTSVPQNILSCYHEGKMDNSVLYKALLLSWNTPKYAYGMIQEELGKRGDVDVETAAIFAELGLNKNPLPPTYNRFFPSLPYLITEEEIASRLDLRSEVIFTIDPASARDLDDAVSIKRISEGVYEVGVHISDVTFFLKEGTPLDIEVAERATTVYMVERAYHMLPIGLCGLCSLLPGEDKLAMSVIFKFDEEGNILDTKFTRSVINSCAQLSYDHAQAFIDGEDVDLPTIHNDVSVSTIRDAILDLNKIALIRRKKRFDSGALKIDQPKVCFVIDSDCNPQEMHVYELKDSNRLIEEYMLLANEAVATYIHSKFPEVALLRRHDPPKSEMMSRLVNSMQKLGIFLDASSAGTLHQTMMKYINGDDMRAAVLNILCAKPMNRALYFCCSDDTHHYALNLEKYTHFTSPIRRYADIVVHRILSACLGYTELPAWTRDDVAKYAHNSNRKKYAAKRAGDLSSNFFRILCIKNVGEMITDAVVISVNSRSVDVAVPSMALHIRVYLNKIDFDFNDNDIGSSLIVKWPGVNSPQVLQVFCTVKVSLTYSEKLENIEAKLVPPEPEACVSLADDQLVILDETPLYSLLENQEASSAKVIDEM